MTNQSSLALRSSRPSLDKCVQQQSFLRLAETLRHYHLLKCAFRRRSHSHERTIWTSQATRKNLEQILGRLDDNTYSAIQATGASLKDITEAKAIEDRKSDIVGQEEQAIPGSVKEVLTILQGTK